ncbi:hypothetical protein GCM10009557_03920 [Virgisporangium ochraceum]|uniref:Uncharacterized protein n=1 Tax=Virgisporangium ochraceum TaxID=65505 RepID=A0A8J3ZZD5_9ACTN|nr:hypothetical protein [Virgisporangium ochraceum]GIJ71677.1 hypothetical protein Voc01_065940 [Virgisporangium ochraceum]
MSSHPSVDVYAHLVNRSNLPVRVILRSTCDAEDLAIKWRHREFDRWFPLVLPRGVTVPPDDGAMIRIGHEWTEPAATGDLPGLSTPDVLSVIVIDNSGHAWIQGSTRWQRTRARTRA